VDKRAVADLTRSGLSTADAEAAGAFSVANARTIYPEFRALPALVLPYADINGEPAAFDRAGKAVPFCRVRYLEEPPSSAAFTKSKFRKYDQPARSGVRAYFPVVSGVDWAAIAEDITQPIILSEGEKKALAATLQGFPCIGLGGVFNYLADGALLPELEAIRWPKRDVYIAFDSDAATNPNIQAAEARLVDELMRHRGARVFLVRLPPLDNGDKCGIDDLIVANGAKRFEQMLLTTEPLGTLDAAVVALNRNIAWIEAEGLVYDIGARRFMKTEALTRGSAYSSIKVRRVVTKGRSPGVKEIPVAAEWLTHPLARRYSDLLFRPGEGPLVQTESGQPGFNVWHGWDAEPGDVEPFMDLTRYLMSTTPAEHRDLPLRLLAYKAQHPAEKIPLALVLIGEQGSGKTLWGECVQRAFAPYSCTLPSSALRDTFQGWLERNLLAVINEVEPEDLETGQDRLKAYISDLQRPMNEKYRVARQINSYTSYILTANKRAAGAFSHGDRRMIVFGTPPVKREQAFYDRIHDWKAADGGKRLLHWLLNYDLQGWKPPAEAPMTPEKAMAYQESLSPIQRLAYDTMTAKEHTIVMWIDQAMTWAAGAKVGNNPELAKHAGEIEASYNTIQIRPWYTPDEISRMFPHIAPMLYGSKKLARTVAGEMSRELRDAGVPYLQCKDDPRGFMWKGRIQQFLVLAHRDDYAEPLSQAEFDRVMKEFPRYSEYVQSLKQQGRRR
jgi:hypothetical protein